MEADSYAALQPGSNRSGGYLMQDPRRQRWGEMRRASFSQSISCDEKCVFWDKA